MQKRLRQLLVVITLLITGWLGGQQRLTPPTSSEPCPCQQMRDKKFDKSTKIVHNRLSQSPLLATFFKDFDLF